MEEEADDAPRGRVRSLSFIDEDGEKLQRGVVEEKDNDKSKADGNADSAGNRPHSEPRAAVPLSQKTLDIITNINDKAAPGGVKTRDAIKEEEEREAAAMEAMNRTRKATVEKKDRTIISKVAGGRRQSNNAGGPSILKNDQHDYYVKILLLGDSGVGKTSLMLRFADNQFQESLMSTAGVDFKVRFLEKNNIRTKCQIWDTAGQERFHVITRTYYKGAHGIALIYDAANEESFKQVDYWMDNIKKHASSDIFVVLLANKSDLPTRKVTFEQGKAVADKYGFKFFETSAKMGTNVVDAFETLSDQIVAKRQSEPAKATVVEENKITLNITEKTSKKKMNCVIL